MATLALDVMNKPSADIVPFVDLALVSPWMTDCGGAPFVTFFTFTANEAKFLAKFTYNDYPNGNKTQIDLFDDFDVPKTDEIINLAVSNIGTNRDCEASYFKEIIQNSLKFSGVISTCQRVINAVTPEDKPTLTGISENNKPFLWSFEVEVNGKYIAKKPIDVMQMAPVARCATQATLDVLKHKQENATDHSIIFRKMDAAQVTDVLKGARMQVVVKL
jgi:hypothetical protein